MSEWLQKILSRPTASVQDAARVLNIGRNNAYDSVRRGEIPVIEFGKRKLVPTAWLRRVLQINEDQ